MKLENGQLRKTVDGKSAIVEFAEGCSLVVHHLTEPKWVACAIPAAMSDEIRYRVGEISIEEHRNGDDVAILVTIGDDMLAFCSTPEAQKFLARRPAMLFTR